MRWTTFVVIALLVAWPARAGEKAAPAGRGAAAPLDLGPVTEKHVMVPMRDGKKLSTYLYFPAGKGPWPVLYEQRYADLRGAGTRQSFARLAAAGYVVAAQNFRGAHLSEGTWIGYRALGWGEKQDGYDTVEWLAAQPWSTGKVGTLGASQAGFAQNFLAVAAPPHLVCQYMIDTGLSLFHEGYRIGGTTRPERFRQMEAICRDPEDNRRLLREWFAHPTYDDYWAAEDCTRHFDRMNVPCFTVGSWFDFMCVGSVESFLGRQHRGGARSRGGQQLLLGPWLHGGFKETNRTAELTFPENARFAMEQHMLRWFDHYLKGKDNGVEREPAVRYYVMGAVGERDAPGNEWRSARDWPVHTRSTTYYLHDGGKLTTTVPAQASGSTTFAANPANPATVPGRAFPGATDARAFEKHADVRTFTSDVLTQPVEWTGKVRAKLWVSSQALDTDFIVRVSDVYPDGRSILLMDYVRRARYREGYDREVLMEPGNVYQVAFDVGWLSQVFNNGHRIRVTVTSTAAPFYEPNPNTGEPLTIEPPKKTVVAKNTIYHNRRYASHVLAPVALPPGAPARAGDADKKTAPVLEQQTLFKAGTGGYHTYRIPSLIVTKKGTLLAFCEGRKNGAGDSGAIDLLLKRSHDGGKTWEKTQVVWHDSANTCGNPCPVVERATGTVWLLLTHNLGQDTLAQILDRTSKGTRTAWVTNSTDDGVTWAKPVEITKEVKRADWTWYATGPGVGIQTKGGRLVIPCDNHVAGSKKQQSHVIFSDDRGKTWKLGGVVGPHCDESQVVELADGKLMLNIRSYRGTKRRLVSLSKDGGETWSEPVQDDALIEPVCQASIVRLPGDGGGLLFSNPASKKRERLTVRLSYNDGRSWPVAKVLHEGPAAYSCLAVLADGSIGCLYERGDKHAYETLTFARFPSSWLTGAQAKPPQRRRILYNLDGDSCIFLKKGSKGPEAITADDLKTAVREITGPGSQVDTLLVCVNAQVMYYPTKVGTMRGTSSPATERKKWPVSEQQRFKNVEAMFDAGIDPYAVLLAEAKKRGREALLTVRMNDDHGNDFLRTAFWWKHPAYRLGKGALDFRHNGVRDHVFRLIEEAVQRYDCDGLELDFQRFPTFFKDGTTEERVAKINSLVERVRQLLDTEGKRRSKRLVLAARIPSDYGRSAPRYETARAIGCDPVAWAKNGWVDFLTVSEFLFVRYDLPIKPWKKLIANVPIYGGIECAEGGNRRQCLTPAKYRHAARHLWADGVDGIYLFNFFTTREWEKDAFEPPFEVLEDLGDPRTMPSRSGLR
ncbi:MAG: CocE/NonD family hydrolase [Planctomycetes bacterium]|nr:CocE/NonD family hydrolase [Planctomycetota bacterium]